VRVAVVGGGVVGLCSAFSLHERGIEVVVLEAGAIGGGASQGNTGWVVPTLSVPLGAPGMLRTGLRSALDPRGALVIRPWAAGVDLSWVRWLWQFRRNTSRERFARGVRALLDLNARTFEALDGYKAAGVAFEQHETGMLVVARDRAGLSWFETLYEELAELGFEGGIEHLDRTAAGEVEPALGDAVGAALRTTVDRYVRPESLTQGLAEFLTGRGPDLRTAAPVNALRREGDGWLVETTAGPERADAVVLATGVSAGELLRPLGVRVPVIGAKGYSVTVAGTGTAPRVALYLSEAKIGVSPFGDVVRIAGLFELPARSAAVEPARARQLVEDTLPYLRDWRPLPGNETAGAWAGLRPATPDSLPLIGELPGFPSLILAAGHGMLGITLAPATGLAVADLVERRPPVWLDAFRPERAI
jgi:D-amino-acid dehydrogenase